jgi:hypothetical protein
MTPAEGIDKLGFRRWYERQLIEGHGYLVTCLLSMILVAAGLEGIDWRGSWIQIVFMLGVIVAGGGLSLASLRRYNFLLFRAECFGAQSSCARCKTYGVLQVTAAGTREERPGGFAEQSDNPWIRVRCKKCGHEWLMENS